MLQPGRKFDRYTVEAHLGTGGMAVVYRVRHVRLDTRHALKVLTVSSPRITRRLLQEGKVQAALQHPNIVAVTDVIDVDGAPGLVMEYIDGPSLEAWLETNRPSLPEAERLFRGIVAGVAAAHAHGVVHRDLKPANVLLAGADRIPKVADFGLAKALVEERPAGMNETRSGMTMGTPAYMAPEQIRDAKAVDHRADLFSLGCILYELVTGRPAFSGPDLLSIFNAVARGHFVDPVALVPDLPAPLREAIAGCLVVDRDRRIPDCVTLQRVLDGKGWTAPPPDRGGSQPTWDALPVPSVASVGEVDSAETFPMPSEAETLAPRPPASGRGSLVPRPRWVAAGAVTAIGGTVLVLFFLAGAFVLKRGWVARTRHTIEAAVGGPIDFGRVALRPDHVRLVGVRVGDPSGAELSIGEIRVDGAWHLDGFALGFEPSRAAVRDVSATVVRTGDGWAVPPGLERLGALRNLDEVTAGPVAIQWVDGGDHAHLDAETARIAPADGRWSLALTGWTAGGVAGGDVLVVRPDGVVEVEDLQLTLEVAGDGRPVVPVGLRDAVPVFLGGASPRGNLAGMVEALEAYLPARPVALTARGGRVELLDRAHGVEPVRWEADLSQLAVGPVASGYLPFDAVAGLGGGRIALEGDVDADGLVRGRLSGRRVPLAPMAPYFREALDARRVALSDGRMDGEIRFSMKADAFAGHLTATVAGAAFSGPGAAALPAPRRPIEADAIGSLADPGFAPVAAWLLALERGLLGAPPVRARPGGPAGFTRPVPGPRAGEGTGRRSPRGRPGRPVKERPRFEEAVRRAMEDLGGRPVRRR